MKWWKKLLVLLVAGVVCGAIMRVMALWVSKNTLSASAAEQTYGDLTYVLHNGNAEITGCAAGVTVLEIPAEIDGSPVTAVGDSAFLKQQKLQTVSLPDSVQSIGSQAFSGCINLQEITVPSGTQSVSNSAFSGCTNLEKAVLGNSVETLGSSVFSGCESLAEVQLSANLQKMGGSVFQNCTALKTVAIPEQVQTLGGSTFSGCSRLYQVTLPAKMTEIQSCAFEDLPQTGNAHPAGKPDHARLRGISKLFRFAEHQPAGAGYRSRRLRLCPLHRTGAGGSFWKRADTREKHVLRLPQTCRSDTGGGLDGTGKQYVSGLRFPTGSDHSGQCQPDRGVHILRLYRFAARHASSKSETDRRQCFPELLVPHGSGISGKAEKYRQ